jgi:hypothetical protein
MWNIEKFRRASGEALRVAVSLREMVVSNELEDSRLPDFVSLSGTFGKPCLPFREHRVESVALNVYEALRQRGEREVIVFENPLYEEHSEYLAVADLRNNGDLRLLVDEKLFDGGYIMSTVTSLFRWLGNFTDYGFMFTDAAVIQDIFRASPSTTYNIASREFRANYGGDFLLDAEIRKLDKLWSALRLENTKPN